MENALTERELTAEWTGPSLDAGRIESELAQLRRLAVGGDADDGDIAMRTSLLNLVVHADDDATAREAGSIIGDLASHHPSRAIIIVAHPDATEPLIETRLAAHCHATLALEQQVCCEEVFLTVHGPAAGHLHSVIVPLLIPGLPVYVWWTGTLPDNPARFEQVLESADRFIIDSARLGDARESLLRLARLCETAGCSLGDLNWERLEAWRNLLEQHLENTPLAEYAGSMGSVKISCAARPGTESVSAQALLLLGWLAHRLNWSTDDIAATEDETLTFTGAGNPVTVEVRPRRYAGVDPGWLVSLSLRCDSRPRRASLSISRIGDAVHVTVSAREGDTVFEDHLRIEGCEAAEMLRSQLDTSPRDRRYERALKRAVPFAQALR